MFEKPYRRSVHPSWLVAVLCLGVVVGLMTAAVSRLPFGSIEWLVLAGLLIIFGFSKKRVYVIPALLLAGFLIGAVRGGFYQAELRPYEAIIGKEVILSGEMMDDADRGEAGEIALRLKNISLAGKAAGGFVWLSTSGDAEMKRGDNVTVRGKLSEGFGSFAASMHRAELVQVERPVTGDVALRVRDTFSDAVRQAVSEPEASLGVGYLVGERRSLPEELDTALKAAGLTHIVVASGYNLTILVNASRRLFVKISKFLAAFFSGGLIISFVAVTGMSPSMSRAGLVTGLSLLTWYYGRRFHPVVLLFLAAAMTLLVQPAYARGDLGWQLSFASFAGVLIVAPLLQNYFYGEKKSGVVRQIFFETLSAFICTVPLIVLAFGQFSNIAILANLLVLPLVPLAMLLTFIAGSVALIVPALATMAGLPAYGVLSYMTAVATFLGDVPWAQTTLEVRWYVAMLYYFALFGLCWYMWRKTSFSFISSSSLDQRGT